MNDKTGVDGLSDGLCSSTDMKVISARMAPLSTEGITAIEARAPA